MALTAPAIIKRVETTVEAGFDLSNKLYRVTQLLPSAVRDYAIYADQTLYLSQNLEQLLKTFPALAIDDNGKLLKDLDVYLKLTNEAFDDIKEALPARPFDRAEPELLLPLDSITLIDQIECLQLGAMVFVTICQLTIPEITETVPVIGKPSTRFAETMINHLKSDVCNMRCTQPKEGRNRRGVWAKRAKAHKAITDLLESFLKASLTAVDIAESADENPKTGEAVKDVDQAKIDFFGADPTQDGMPANIVHHPDNVYAKLHTKDVDERSLKFHNLPYSRMKDNDKYWIVWQSMQVWQCDNLFTHTKKLRINEELADIKPKETIKALQKRWLGADTVEESGGEDVIDMDLQELDTMLAELRSEDERGRPALRSHVIRDRSWSPLPVVHSRPAPRPRHRYRSLSRERTSKTEYWRSWGEQESQLHQALGYAGWKPVYMRGTDDGQTWFYGSEVVHVRRFTGDYTPHDGTVDKEDEKKNKPDVKEYLVISNEWIEEEALNKHGYQFQLLPSSHYALDPRLTWGDIELLVSASATFREERLFRKFRTAEKGDLHEPRPLSIPGADYINGPASSERQAFSSVYHVPTMSNHYRQSTTLEEVTEEQPQTVFRGRQQDVMTPGAESQDSFVEVAK